MRALYVLAAVVVVAALLLTLLWVFQRQLIYFPGWARAGRAGEVMPGGRDVTLKTSDHLQLGAWYFRVGGGGHVTVLVASGNAGNRSLRAPLAVALARAGLSVLLFDYRGFSGNPGTPTEEGLGRDARAAHRFLVDEVGVRPDRLLYYGESLGAAVVTRLAAELAPGGLVLRSPFFDLASIGGVHYPFLPVRALLKDRYHVARSERSGSSLWRKRPAPARTAITLIAWPAESWRSRAIRARSSAIARRRSRSASRWACVARSLSSAICSRRRRVRSPANQATAQPRPVWKSASPGNVPSAAAVAARYATKSVATAAVVRGAHRFASSRVAASR